jgi:uncharacterized protein (DUF952 family)
MTIYKILPKQLWYESVDNGSFTGSPIDIADGFIHFSTAAQLHETARRHFSGVPDLLLVAVAAGTLGDALKWELSRDGGDVFPHLYGSLPVNLAIWVKPLPLDSHFRPVVPEL